jgi:hypothetical protein
MKNSDIFSQGIYDFILSNKEFSNIRYSTTLKNILKNVYKEIIYLDSEKSNKYIKNNLISVVLDNNSFIQKIFDYITSIPPLNDIRLSTTLVNLLKETYNEISYLKNECKKK